MNMIVACTERGVIGLNGKMPWSIPDEMQKFRALTYGEKVVMGSGTWESIGRKLDGRENVVISNKGKPPYVPEDVIWTSDLEKHIDGSFCIGGELLYLNCLKYTKTIYLSIIKGNYHGDRFFPIDAVLKEFKVKERHTNNLWEDIVLCRA